MVKEKIKLTTWNILDHLKTEEEITGFLEVACEENGDDPAYMAYVLGIVAKARGMTKIAKQTGLTRSTLYHALSKKGNPEFSTVLKVISALGLRLQIVK